MKKLNRFLAVLLSIIILGTFVSSVVCTYYFELDKKALWWSWILIFFVVDIAFGLYIFYNSKRPDETKVFWLIIILLLPIIGCCLFLLFGFTQRCNFAESDNNHARLLNAIFNARKSIKIYSDNFFPSYDTFHALNVATFKDVNVEILLFNQDKKSKQEYLEYKLEQLLDKRVNLYFTNLCVQQSFIIIDDKQVIACPHNFNFKYIYSDNKFKITDDIKQQASIWEQNIIRSSKFDYSKAKFSRAKKLKFAIINIFYSFL